MLSNLRAEMARARIPISDIAKLLEVRYATALDKIHGRSRLHVNDAFKIRNTFFPDCSFEYLFESDQQITGTEALYEKHSEFESTHF